jgi:serine/threonine protein kinase
MRRPASTPPQLPGYEYTRLLGSGGFSDVFLYEQHLPRRSVAVKVLLTEEITPATRAAFVAEANVMAQLSAHPYIATIFHADVAADGRPYFVMEYCAGPSLAEQYKRSPLPVADALRAGVRLSSAVATAHAAGILHRDIKPGNVLTNDYGWPALTDFGIASALEDEAVSGVTTTAAAIRAGDDTSGATSGQSVGMSVPWSPPEMFDDDPVPDVRSDIFSLAATIWTVLAGQTPFEVRGRGNGTLDLIGRIERGAITPMERTDVPRSLIAVLQKGMASRRDDRFVDAVAFARALQRVELELGYSPTAIEVPNVQLAASDAAGSGDGAQDGDKTQVRGIATIEAQAGPSVVTPTAVPDADRTVVRSQRVIDAQAAVPAGAAGASQGAGAAGASSPGTASVVGEATIIRSREPAVAEPAPVAASPVRRSRILPWVLGGAAVLIAGGVTAGIVLGGVVTPDPVPTSAGPTGGAIVLDTVPTPELAGPAVVDGTTLTFPLKNPDPADGDRFVWRLDPAPDEGYRPLDGDTLTVADYVQGTTVCVEVFVLREAKTSPMPLRSCFPS